MELKINKNTIKKQLDSPIAKMANCSFDYEFIAKCHLYLSNISEAMYYFDVAIKDYLIVPKMLYQNNDTMGILMRLTKGYNLLKYLDQKNKLLECFSELNVKYELLDKETDLPLRMRVQSGFYFSWATINFHLGNYEKAVELGELFKWKIPVAPCDYARGLLLNDKQIIEDTLEGIIKYIKNDRIQPFHWPNNVEDPWEWYEIGRQLLGLPSKLDEITEYIRTKDDQ